MPDRIGRYDVVREIGRGGMGRVFEATHRALGKSVAIKRLHDDVAADAVSRSRLLAEGRAIARMRHPHVVDVLDFEEHEGVPYLVMEPLQGVTLSEHLARRGALPVEEAVDLLLPIVSALAAAHAIGVVHRDVKPANVFLRSGGDLSPCLLDFGVSRNLGTDADSLTRSGALVGSFAYFSPEHARGARRVDPFSDQFSLAIVLYECVTGVRPFKGETPYELMHAIIRADPEPPSALRPAVPAEFDAMVLRALRAEPSQRYPSMRAFGSAMVGFASRRGWHVWAPELARAASVAGDECTQDDPSEEHAASSLSVKPDAGARAWRLRSLRATLLLAVVACVVFVVAREVGSRPLAATRPDETRPSAQALESHGADTPATPAPSQQAAPVDATAATKPPTLPSATKMPQVGAPRSTPSHRDTIGSAAPAPSRVPPLPPPSSSEPQNVLDRWE
jgi:serine/threonine-protein kinase